MASYLRLLFPALAPAEIERVLYLEADVPVMDDLGAVWRREPEGRPVAGVRDYLVPGSALQAASPG